MPVVLLTPAADAVAALFRDVDTVEAAAVKYGLAPSLLRVGDHAPGMLYKGKKFVAPPQPAGPVPIEATKLGLVRALRAAGHWGAVKVALATDEDMQDDWNAAVSIRRDDPAVLALASALSLTTANIEAIFTAATA